MRKLLAKGVVGQDAFWEISCHPASVFSANNHLYIGAKTIVLSWLQGRHKKKPKSLLYPQLSNFKRWINFILIPTIQLRQIERIQPILKIDHLKTNQTGKYTPLSN